MTHYDKLIDSIVDEIYYVWTECSSWCEDDQDTAKEAAHRILQHVEEFQTVRSGIKQWRASD
jgi:hypothetical protein